MLLRYCLGVRVSTEDYRYLCIVTHCIILARHPTTFIQYRTRVLKETLEPSGKKRFTVLHFASPFEQVNKDGVLPRLRWVLSSWEKSIYLKWSLPMWKSQYTTYQNVHSSEHTTKSMARLYSHRTSKLVLRTLALNSLVSISSDNPEADLSENWLGGKAWQKQRSKTWTLILRLHPLNWKRNSCLCNILFQIFYGIRNVLNQDRHTDFHSRLWFQSSFPFKPAITNARITRSSSIIYGYQLASVFTAKTQHKTIVRAKTCPQI